VIEPNLFRLPTGYQLTVRLERNRTWTVIADRFFEGEPWSSSDRDVYEALSLTEACDVMLSVVYGG
jgi:hypothetical protein